MFLELIFKLPSMIFRGINAVCYYFTALLIVFYSILTGGPRSPSASVSAQASQNDEWDEISELSNKIMDGISLGTVRRNINDLSNKYGWSSERRKEVTDNLLGTYYSHKINEFIDSNDELYNVSSGNRVSILQNFDSLIGATENYLNRETKDQFRTEFYKRITNNAKNEIDLVINASLPESLNTELPKIKMFYKDLGYSPSKIESTIKQFTKI